MNRETEQEIEYDEPMHSERRGRGAFRADAQRELVCGKAQSLCKVHLKTPTGHPIVYRKRIDGVEGNPRPGEYVAVLHEGELQGFGIYNPRSELALRIVRWGAEPPDDAFWDQTLSQALSLRHDLLKIDETTNAYRLIHAEGDAVTGLVADKYDSVVSVEAFSMGMLQRAQAIGEKLCKLVGAKHLRIRPGPHMIAQEGYEGLDYSSEGCPAQVTITEHGVRYKVRFAGSHKTGFFCDQRDNRKRLTAFCKDKNVLDLCCYTGGFSVMAKKLGGAKTVTGVDLDREPLELAKENANLNQVRVDFAQNDAFAYMRDLIRQKRRFDVVVLDPPKLITNRRELEEGSAKHFDLNRLAFQLLAEGGVMLTCSCAGLLSDDEFTRIVLTAARKASYDRKLADPASPLRVQLFEKSGASPDHPTAANCPEASYLKAMWLRAY
jgi:23S rRNA (cytosine1962-C5)-methyltransferase